MIVEAGSISAASSALGVTKSLLSQHLARLEQSLGVRLIERTTRRLHVTTLGQRFHRRCQAMLAEAESALTLIENVRETVCGTLKINCPVVFAQVILMPVVTRFLHEHPDVDLVLDADYREIDLIGEGYDLALRIQQGALDDSRFVVRSFPLDQLWLAASPSWVEQTGLPANPEALHEVESAFLLNDGDNAANTAWTLFDADHVSHIIHHHPRLTSSDPIILKNATLAGIGPALLPSSLCERELAEGRLIRLLPEFHGGDMQLHAVYPSRDGLSRTARCFLDLLTEHLPLQIHKAADAQ